MVILSCSSFCSLEDDHRGWRRRTGGRDGCLLLYAWLLKSRVNSYDFTSLRVKRHKTSQLVCRIEFYRIESEFTSLPIRVYEFTGYEFTILRFYEFTKFSLVHNFEVKNKNIFIPNNVYIYTQSLSISYFGSSTNPKRCCVCVLVVSYKP